MPSKISHVNKQLSFPQHASLKQGRSGEYFQLGSYGQRQVGFDGTLTLSNSDEAYSSNPEPRTRAYKRPRRVPRNPNRRSILSEEDLRR